mmetsp:Transcript_1960/g.5492  ORF Transcript_1960/g.5492 Transcript_1960/m.5492 type:complete len:543 (-) Transcript_1960:733-2361(-)
MSSPSSSASAKPCCLKASTSIQPKAHWTSKMGSRKCSSKKIWPRPRNQLQSDSTTMCRDGKGTAANACAELMISSRSKAPRLPCTKAQSESVRAAMTARARLCRLFAAGCDGKSSCLKLRNNSKRRHQCPRADSASREQKRQMAEMVAISTSSDNAGKLTTGRKIWSSVPDCAGSFCKSECDHFNNAFKMDNTRNNMESRSACNATCSFVKAASSLSFFFEASLSRCACMNSSFAMAFFFCSANTVLCCFRSSMASLSSCSLKLSRVAKWPSLSSCSSSGEGWLPPCKGWHKSLTKSTARVLHCASSAWCLEVRAWNPRPRPAHFLRMRMPNSAVVYCIPPPPARILALLWWSTGARMSTASASLSALLREASSVKSTDTTMWRSWRRISAPCCRPDASPNAWVARANSTGTSTASSRSSSLIAAMACRTNNAMCSPSMAGPCSPSGALAPLKMRWAKSAPSLAKRLANAPATASPRASSEATSQHVSNCTAEPSKTCLRQASTARPAPCLTCPERSNKPTISRAKPAGPNSRTVWGCFASV